MADHELLGQRIEHIRIVDLLVRGGMGAVYVGFDEKLECQIYDYLEGEDRDFLVRELIEGKSLKEVIAERPDEATRMRIATEVVEVLAATHARGIIHRDLKPSNVMVTMSQLGLLNWRQGRLDQAEPLYRQALELSQRLLGQDHPETLSCEMNLASLYRSQGRFREGEPLYERNLASKWRAPA